MTNIPTRIEGYYLNGKTSRRFNASLEVVRKNKPSFFLHINSDTDSDENHHDKLALEFADFSIESRLGNTPRELAFNNDQLFITQDNEAIDSLVLLFKDTSSVNLHQFESKLTLVLIASILTIALIWSFVVYGIPASAKFIAHKIPVFASEKLASGLDILDQTVFEPSELDEARQQHIRQLVAPYLAEFHDLNPQMKFRSGMKANALALPGGEIVFTDDFVNLTENDEELLAVFFHELGHLKHKHITRRVLQDSMITLMILLITGEVESVDLISALPTVIMDLSYSREFEVEADSYALELMHEKNIPLDNFSSIMQRLQEFYSKNKASKEKLDKGEESTDFKVPDFLSTHPATKERIKMTEAFIKKYKDEQIN